MSDHLPKDDRPFADLSDGRYEIAVKEHVAKDRWVVLAARM